MFQVNNYAKLHEQPKFTTDYTPEKIQEIILEGEKTNNRNYYCRVTIQRRGSTGEYIGDLYLEEDHGLTKEDTRVDGRACRFFVILHLLLVPLHSYILHTPSFRYPDI